MFCFYYNMNDNEIKFTKNSIYRLRIDDMNSFGAGVSRIGKMVVFVQNAVTGDLCDVKIIKVAKNYLVGRIEKLIEASPVRINSDCPMSRRCGGCVYRNVTYSHELERKRNTVESLMRKAGLDVRVREPLHGDPDGYRNKAQYPVGRAANGSVSIGFYAGKTHEIINMTELCRLQPEIFGRIVEFLRKFLTENKIEPYDESTGRGIVRHIYLRRAWSTGKVMVCVVVTAKFDKSHRLAKEIMSQFDEISGVLLNYNPENTNVVLGKKFELLAGEAELHDELCGRKFSFAPDSFWQVNRDMASVLYKKAGELADIKPGEKVLDLFCGIGSVGQSICEKTTKLYGIEIVPAAVENAKKNAAANGFSDAEYLCLDADDPDSMRRELLKIGQDLDVIILDPPRGGCSPELLRLVSENTNARIVYISCGPDTLARDLAILVKLGYKTSDISTVDLFPRTGHIESVCLIERK